jgi:hypothetical protein
MYFLVKCFYLFYFIMYLLKWIHIWWNNPDRREERSRNKINISHVLWGVMNIKVNLAYGQKWFKNVFFYIENGIASVQHGRSTLKVHEKFKLLVKVFIELHWYLKFIVSIWFFILLFFSASINPVHRWPEQPGYRENTPMKCWVHQYCNDVGFINIVTMLDPSTL